MALKIWEEIENFKTYRRTGQKFAAAVSVKDKMTCRNVDISKVQKELRKQGVRIDQKIIGNSIILIYSQFDSIYV